MMIARDQPTYNRWRAMKARVRGYDLRARRDYVNRGISICDEWKYFWNFHDWAMANGFKPELTLDRIDNNGDYCPENCRWATHSQQNRNKRNTKLERRL